MFFDKLSAFPDSRFICYKAPQQPEFGTKSRNEMRGLIDKQSGNLFIPQLGCVGVGVFTDEGEKFVLDLPDKGIIHVAHLLDDRVDKAVRRRGWHSDELWQYELMDAEEQNEIISQYLLCFVASLNQVDYMQTIKALFATGKKEFNKEYQRVFFADAGEGGFVWQDNKATSREFKVNHALKQFTTGFDAANDRERFEAIEFKILIDKDFNLYVKSFTFMNKVFEAKDFDSLTRGKSMRELVYSVRQRDEKAPDYNEEESGYGCCAVLMLPLEIFGCKASETKERADTVAKFEFNGNDIRENRPSSKGFELCEI